MATVEMTYELPQNLEDMVDSVKEFKRAKSRASMLDGVKSYIDTPYAARELLVQIEEEDPERLRLATFRYISCVGKPDQVNIGQDIVQEATNMQHHRINGKPNPKQWWPGVGLYLAIGDYIKGKPSMYDPDLKENQFVAISLYHTIFLSVALTGAGFGIYQLITNLT